MKNPRGNHPSLSALRIIGGRWRGRKLIFTPTTSLRPTTEVNRERLFNWLAPYLAGANCLDLFAGSGALGFEALSRGADRVTMVDISGLALEQLRSNAARLGTEAIDFYRADIPTQLAKINPQEFNVLFLDPPYQTNLVVSSSWALETANYVSNQALIYLECERALDPLLPPTWKILRKKQNRSTSSYLYQKE